MKPLHAVVVGGGPSGLYFAYLLKKSSPASRVAVIEQNAPDATFGFGVVLADRGLERLEQADAESYRQFIRRMHRNKNQLIHHGDDAILVDSTGYGGAISRLSLLTVLKGLCEQVGVELHFSTRVQILPEADLVIGADGVNSMLRTADGSDFGLRAEKLTNWFAWYGTRARFDTPALNFRRYGGGHFVAHYYPYSDDMGTFVAECDARTWSRLGLGAMADDERRRLVEEIFADALQGQPLISNKSIWRNFVAAGTERWYLGNRVLLGDALNSAHFSIGSGTRIAMEDSIALWEAVAASDTLPQALERFERERRPAKQKLLKAARASYLWYEGFADKMEALAPMDFVYDFMTRTGRMDDARLREQHPQFMARYESCSTLPSKS
jgi:2-polyprenyl-6-methoxyphenol hydroxylase-like FAD-dependent oxidoreductase